MFKKGDVFDNPVTGERATILLGTRETRGDRLVVELELQGAGFGSALHKHPSIHERLKVVSGRVGLILHNEISIVEPGKMIEIGSRRTAPVLERRHHSGEADTGYPAGQTI